MMRIVHISDLHFGMEFNNEKFQKAIRQINEIEPDLVIVTGDLVLWGIHNEFREAYEGLSNIKSDMMVIPGNHDARNDGIKYFELYFGKTRKSTVMDDFVIIAADSTNPDTDDGMIGEEQREWMRTKLKRDKVNIIALHHHIVPIPHTGRNRNVLMDSAEMIEALMLHCPGGVVLAGHRHVPYSTKLLRTHIIHAGTLSSYKVLMPDNNFNIIDISRESVKLTLRFVELGEVEIGEFMIKNETSPAVVKYHSISGTKKVLFVSKDHNLSSMAERIFNENAPSNMVAIKVHSKKISKELLNDVDYVVTFDEDVEADEYWKITNDLHEQLKRACRELVRKLILIKKIKI